MDKTGTMTGAEPKLFRSFRSATTRKPNSSLALQRLRRGPRIRWRARFALCRTAGIAPAPAADVQVLRGKGVTGIFDGEPFWLGSHRYVVERGQDTPEIARQAEALEADGKTVIVVGNARHVCGSSPSPTRSVRRRGKSCGNCTRPVSPT